MTRKEMARSVQRSLGLVCIGALLAPPPAWAGVEPQPFRTGLFGITAGQAIRVSVLNAGGEKGIVTPCFNPSPLVAAVGIRDLKGGLLFKSRTEPVLDGTGTFVDVVPAPDVRDPSPTGARTPGGMSLASAPTRRLQVRAEVVLADDDPVRARCGGVALTLEVFDIATGRTEFTMPFAAVMFNPQPEPPEPIAVP